MPLRMKHFSRRRGFEKGGSETHHATVGVISHMGCMLPTQLGRSTRVFRIIFAKYRKVFRESDPGQDKRGLTKTASKGTWHHDLLSGLAFHEKSERYRRPGQGRSEHVSAKFVRFFFT